MYPRMITKSLFVFFFLYAISIYGSVANDLKIPKIIGDQWFTLTSLIVLITTFGALCLIVINIDMIFEIDKDSKQFKLKLYELLNESVISPIWHWILLVSAICLFQITHYGDAIVTIILYTFLVTFRIAHLNVIRQAKIQELNATISPKK